MIQLFTDTSANLPLELLRKHNILCLHFSYSINGVPVPYDEETDFDGKSFFEAMRKGDDVKTSLINVGMFKEAFEKVLKAGNDIIYVGMSGGISGTANAASVAAEELREKYPDRKIATIDTYAASLGEGMQALDAAKLLGEGKTFDEIVSEICEKRHTMCQYFTVDDLKYLKKNGRISGAAALIGNALRIKPILKGDETGHIIMCGKVRGQRSAMETLAEKYDLLCRDKNADIGIAHCDNEAAVDMLLGMLREKGFKGECLTVWYEPVTGAHVGPGTVALFYPGTEK